MSHIKRSSQVCYGISQFAMSQFADMDILYRQHLSEWASEAAVKSVLVEGSTARAFCAGGSFLSCPFPIAVTE